MSPLGEDFISWLREQDIDPQSEDEECLHELLCDWRMTGDYECIKCEHVADHCRCSTAGHIHCTCTYDGEGLTPQIPGLTCDDYRGIGDLGDLLNYTHGQESGRPLRFGPVPAGVHLYLTLRCSTSRRRPTFARAATGFAQTRRDCRTWKYSHTSGRQVLTARVE